MQLEDIQGNALIIADSYLHNDIRTQLLNQKEAVSNIAILSLNTYLESLTSEKKEDVFYKYYETLTTLDLHVFKEVAISAEFISEILSFIGNLKRYQIDADTLPSKDPYQKELKMMVSALIKIPLLIDYELEAFNEVATFQDVYILDYAEDFFKREIYNCMEAKGAKRLKRKEKEVAKDFYYVLNKREEVEALARYIIEHHIDVRDAKLTMLNEEYIGFIEQIFSRYQIPFSFVSSYHKEPLLYKYMNLLIYYQNPNQEHLLNVLTSGVFHHLNIDDLISYMHIFQVEISDVFSHVERMEFKGDILHKSEYKQLLVLEARARECKEAIVGTLMKLQDLSMQEALFYIDEIICEEHVFSKVVDLKLIRQIRKEISQYLPYEKKVPISFLLYKLEKLQVQELTTYEGLHIATLGQPLGDKKYHFIIGANSDNYPNFPARTGLFSEDYVATFEYPSYQSRYELHTDNLAHNLISSDIVVAFYATSSLDGKDKEAALEIESFMSEKPKYYKLPFIYRTTRINTQLSYDTSKQLFAFDQVYKGSISSYEMYQNCPFQYFIRYGLHISEPTTYGIDSSKTGTIMHAVLEALVKRYAKAYVNIGKEEIRHLLDEKAEEIVALYPQLQSALNVAKGRILFQLEKNMQVLKEVERHSVLTPSKTEQEFVYEIQYEEEVLKLNGYIDRIDENNDFIVILDYKSSAKKLSEAEVFSALKLQLLTYLVVASRIYQKRVLGAYYYSLGNTVQNGIYATFIKKGSEIKVQTREDYETTFMKSKSFVGWTTSEDVDVFNDDLSLVSGVNIKADGTYGSGVNIYDIDGLEKLMISLYEGLLSEIKQGNMRIAPVSCAFCKYDSICHYKGKPFEREVVASSEDIYIVHNGKGGIKKW